VRRSVPAIAEGAVASHVRFTPERGDSGKQGASYACKIRVSGGGRFPEYGLGEALGKQKEKPRRDGRASLGSSCSQIVALVSG
jgi:hypothetical protein